PGFLVWVGPPPGKPAAPPPDSALTRATVKKPRAGRPGASFMSDTPHHAGPASSAAPGGAPNTGEPMVVVMAPDATQADLDGIVDLVRGAGGEAFITRGVSRTIVGLVGDVDRFRTLNLRSMPGVTDVVRISVPY